MLCCLAYLFCLTTSEVKDNLATSNGLSKRLSLFAMCSGTSFDSGYALLMKANEPETRTMFLSSSPDEFEHAQ